MLRVVSGDSGAATPPEAAGVVLRVDLRSLSLGGSAVLGAIRLELKAGETLVLTGPSGIGKTSLLRCIAGLERRHDGQIEAPARMGMVFQEPTLLPWRSLMDNLRLTSGVAAKEAQAALDEVGLGDKAGLFPGQLSLGQQRRLSLARAFACKPQVLLMDEPFVSLDPSLAEEMMALFARLRAAQNVATILVTHSETEAKTLGSRIIRLGGSPATIVDDAQNAGAYFQLSASGVTSSRS